MDRYFARSRAGRITGYSATIFWNMVLFVFFSFFYQYIAWYHTLPNGTVVRLPLLTSEYFKWLPFLDTALIITIIANILLIIYDRYWLRETVHIILNVIGMAVVANLVSIFPFNFSVLPNTQAAYFVPVAVTIFLIIVAIGLGVGALVRLIKLFIHLVRQTLD